MKLSQMKTEDALAKTCELINPIANIMEDTKCLDAMRKMADKANKNKTNLQLGLDFIKIFVPVVLVDHKSDFFEILGILNGKDIEIIRDQTLVETIRDIKNSVDTELIEVFKSSTITEQAK